MPISGKVGERGIKVGAVDKYHLKDSYNLEPISVVIPVGGLPNGAVLESVSGGGTYNLVVLATVADASAVLLDEGVYDEDVLLGGTFTLAALVRGPAEVSKDTLVYNADVVDIPAANAILTANTSIVIKDTV